MVFTVRAMFGWQFTVNVGVFTTLTLPVLLVCSRCSLTDDHANTHSLQERKEPKHIIISV